MGIYLNPNYNGFKKSINSKIYVDKTELIEFTNSVINTKQQNICVSRPRRFGKTMAAEMLIAYYCSAYDSSALFKNLKITGKATYTEHLNKYNVLFLNMQNFLSDIDNINDWLSYIKQELMIELKQYFENIVNPNRSLSVNLENIYSATDNQFVIIIDEWDCIFRVAKDNIEIQKSYLDFLRNLLKDRSYVALAYMTGILPIKKYGTHSALNMFDEFSMLEAGDITAYTGFTTDEVEELCTKYSIDFSEMDRWYNGYLIGEEHIYNPKSVVDSVKNKKFANYWTRTETYEALKIYFDNNLDGFKDSIIEMLGGEHIPVDTSTFNNDMISVESRDDLFTLLIHLGYLSYDRSEQKVFIPNEEVRAEFVTAIKASKWDEVTKAVEASKQLLVSTINMDENAVADAIDKLHSESTSILSYNNENSLSCVISLAYYIARQHYIIVRELPSGRGFADLAFIPRKNSDKPAMIIELKWDNSAEGAVGQIKNKNYSGALKGCADEILLVGINYNKTDKKHSCKIEKITL